MTGMVEANGKWEPSFFRPIPIVTRNTFCVKIQDGEEVAFQVSILSSHLQVVCHYFHATGQ